MFGWHRWYWPVHLLQGLERDELFCRLVLKIQFEYFNKYAVIFVFSNVSCSTLENIQ